MKKIIFAFFIWMFSAGIFAQEGNFVHQQVRIYFVNWDILTRTNLTAENVKTMRSVYVEINDLPTLSKILHQLNRLSCKKSDSPPDARLVIEIIREEKIYKTYSANKQYVYSDGNVCRVNRGFLDSLNFFPK